VVASASFWKGSAKLTAVVRANGVALGGVSVTFRVTDPTGSVRTATATTSSSGVASASMKLRPKDPRGTYQVQATATSGGVSGSDTTTFVN
jgi:uncharacterized protein YfaS (alpha-2-macroglobulin family)